jgi:hypothetical protein
MRSSLLVIALCVLTIALASTSESLVEKFFRYRLDTDGNGVADIYEVARYLKTMDSDMQVEIEHVKALVARLDTNLDGRWSMEEFVDAHRSLHDVTVPNGDSTPKQVHLSITGKPGQRVVMWVTDGATSTSVVQYGTQSGTYTGSTAGSTHTYTEGGWKGVIHEVLLDGLVPDTVYVCRFVESSKILIGRIFAGTTTEWATLRPTRGAMILPSARIQLLPARLCLLRTATWAPRSRLDSWSPDSWPKTMPR